MARSTNSQRGHSFIEFAFFIPWIIFLFVGVLDLGFYTNALISTESAARVAALYTSSSSASAADATTACYYALEELRMAPNVGSGVTTCTAFPVKVTATSVTGYDGQQASLVSVTYQTIQMIPIPGLLTGQLTFTRSVQMRIRG